MIDYPQMGSSGKRFTNYVSVFLASVRRKLQKTTTPAVAAWARDTIYTCLATPPDVFVSASAQRRFAGPEKLPEGEQGKTAQKKLTILLKTIFLLYSWIIVMETRPPSAMHPNLKSKPPMAPSRNAYVSPERNVFSHDKVDNFPSLPTTTIATPTPAHSALTRVKKHDESRRQ